MVEFTLVKILELVGRTQVVPVGGYAVAHLLLGKGVHHLVFMGHLADPVAVQHGTRWGIEWWKHWWKYWVIESLESNRVADGFGVENH